MFCCPHNIFDWLSLISPIYLICCHYAFYCPHNMCLIGHWFYQYNVICFHYVFCCLNNIFDWSLISPIYFNLFSLCILLEVSATTPHTLLQISGPEWFIHQALWKLKLSWFWGVYYSCDQFFMFQPSGFVGWKWEGSLLKYNQTMFTR